MALPFLTLTDPKTTGEGVLDPLGLSLVADQLADEILPGASSTNGAPTISHGVGRLCRCL